MKIKQWADLSEEERVRILARPKTQASRRSDVERIVENVRRSGDQALREFTKSFDGCALDELRVPVSELVEASEAMSRELTEAMDQAMQNIEAYHRLQLRTPYTISVMDGVELTREIRPIEKVGLYIPGGTAPLLSSLLMLIIPARLAACPSMIIATPPARDGRINSNLLGAAYRLGVSEIYRIGGAQAIAAMAYGTESVPKVDKIFGPGNSWVTEAKILVSQDPEGATSDLPAGPSELIVVGDKQSNPRFIAADLLAQAEHGADSQVIFVGIERDVCERVQIELQLLVEKVSRRETVMSALEHARFLVAEDLDEALTIINRYAPEHLSLQISNARETAERIQNAGTILCGPWSATAAGDYASGTNHVLPTGTSARIHSGLSVESFQKTISIQTLTKEGLLNLEKTLEVLTAVEGLDAHRLSIRVRLEKGGRDA